MTQDLEANEIDLFDSKGELRATLSMEDDGKIEIVYWHPREPGRLGRGGSQALTLSPEGLSLTSRTSKSEIRFSFGDNESPRIEMLRNRQVVWSTEEQEELEVDDLRAGEISVVDRKGRTRISLILDGDGNPILGLHDKAGKRRIALSLDESDGDNDARLVLRDPSGQDCIDLYVNKDRHAQLGWVDSEGRHNNALSKD